MDYKSFGTAMYIIDEDYKILYQNEESQKVHKDVKVGDICYKVYGGVDRPCTQCPIQKKNSLMYNPHRKEWISTQAAAMEYPEGKKCYAIQFQLKQRLEVTNECLADDADVDDYVADICANNGGECLIGAYCEEGFPLFYVNDNMIALLGYDSREELLAAIDGMIINIVHPDDRENVLKETMDGYVLGEIYENMFRAHQKDGTWLWTFNKGKVLETKSGRKAIISICTDMTGYFKRQENLRLQNIDLQKKDFLTTAMMNNMPSGYHRCAAEEGLPFLFIGSHFESIVGWTREEIEREFDNRYLNLLWPEDAGAITTYSDLLQMKGKGNAYTTDIYRIKRKGGGYRWVLDSIMFVDLGEESFLQATLADITHFVETQNEQKRELEEAMKRVEVANNAKTQFLSSMSHDIRTPMNAIIGMTTLASQHLDNMEYVKKCLGKMSLASRHLVTLINDALDISKVESGKMYLNPMIFSLSETVSNLIGIVRQQISGKNQKFEVRVHNIKQEYLFADELRLNQIFINILTNAVRYTPNGGLIRMDIRQEPIEGAEDRVRIIYIVQDSGVGMSPEFQQNMYNSFVRAGDDNYGSSQGTGLGLTIAKRMVELMEGTIECKSQLGVGTKFTITLDLPIADKVIEELTLPSMDILLVDDDEIFLESAAETLRGLGVMPYCVNRGRAAVENALKRHEKGDDYAVIIVDWQMSGMNGLETIRELRAALGVEVPIAVTTAYEWADIEELAMDAGANGFIGKPFFPSNVYGSIAELLGLAAEKPAEEEIAFDIAGMRILVAEDNDLNWEIARDILKMYHVETVRAENGQECVDILNEAEDGEFDLVLMDIRMPVMNGYEACMAIRESGREYVSNIPIIAMTADAFSDDIQRCLSVGMNAHIAKPVNINQLLSVLEKKRTLIK